MNDAPGMGGIEAGGDGQQQGYGRLSGQLVLTLQTAAECLAVQQLHRNEGVAAGGHAEVEHTDHGGMADPGCGPCFASQPLGQQEADSIGVRVGVHDLDGQSQAHGRVRRHPDGTAGARAYQALQRVLRGYHGPLHVRFDAWLFVAAISPMIHGRSDLLDEEDEENVAAQRPGNDVGSLVRVLMGFAAPPGGTTPLRLNSAAGSVLKELGALISAPGSTPTLRR